MSILLLAYLVQNEGERICAFGLWVQMKLKEYMPLDYEWCGTSNLGETSLYHYRINFVLELSKLLYKLLTREGSGGCSQRATLLGHVYDRGWDGWMASQTQWTWVWVDSGSWWWTGRPGMLWFMGSQRVAHDWATELNEGTDILLSTVRRWMKMEGRKPQHLWVPQLTESVGEAQRRETKR